MPTRPSAGQVILFHGLKRSGNHVVLNWIRSGGDFYFLNNVFPVGKLVRAGRIDRLRPRCLPWSFRRRARLISIEDLSVHQPLFRNLPARSQQVVLVRDPRNLFASRIRKGFQVSHVAYPREMNASMQRAIGLWKEHARLCLAQLTPAAGTLGVVFDHWLVNPPYRAAIAAWLGIEPREQSLEQQAREGGGSSFAPAGGSEPAGAQTAAEVLHRERHLNAQESDLLAEILDDAEMLALRDELLGAVSGLWPPA